MLYCSAASINVFLICIDAIFEESLAEGVVVV